MVSIKTAKVLQSDGRENKLPFIPSSCIENAIYQRG